MNGAVSAVEDTGSAKSDSIIAVYGGGIRQE
jgi:hypothetical protein